MWRNGKHRRMLRLIGQLRRGSRFAAAVANDEEHVALILEAEKNQPKKDSAGYPLADWTTTNDQMAALVDGQNTMIAVLVKANGGNPGRIKPSARPTTKFAEVAEQKAVSRHRATVARVRKRPLPVE